MSLGYYGVSGVGPVPNDLVFRVRLLWAAIKNLFTGRGLTLSGGMSGSFGTDGMFMEQWIKPQSKEQWEYWACTFDGKVARGYVNGEQV